MHTKHWIPLTAHKFKGKNPTWVEHGEKCSTCGEEHQHASHRTDLIGAAVIDFLQSQGDGSVEVKAVIMLANGGLVVSNMIGHTGREPLLFAAPMPGVNLPTDVFEESPILPPPPRPRRSRRAS